MQVHYETLRREEDMVRTDRKGKEMRIEQRTVEVTINGDRRRVRCGSEWNGRVTIFDLAVRFSQGAKVWRGTATYWVKSGNVNHIRPCIDKHGYFFLAGYFADYDKKPIVSQHNAM